MGVFIVILFRLLVSYPNKKTLLGVCQREFFFQRHHGTSRCRIFQRMYRILYQYDSGKRIKGRRNGTIHVHYPRHFLNYGYCQF